MLVGSLNDLWNPRWDERSNLVVSRQSGESITATVNNSSLLFKVWNLHQLEQKGTLMEEDWHPTKPWTLALEMHLASSWCRANRKVVWRICSLIPSWGGHGQCRWLRGDRGVDFKLDLALQVPLCDCRMAPTVQWSQIYISNCEMGEHCSGSPGTSEVNAAQGQSSDLGCVVFGSAGIIFFTFGFYIGA